MSAISRKPARRAPLALESLEGRLTPATLAFFSAGVLSVYGDSANNNILVSADTVGRLQVTSNGAAVAILGGAGVTSAPSAVEAAARARAGRRRFPPALMRWPATSVRKGSSASIDASRAVSTRVRSAPRRGSRSSEARSITPARYVRDRRTGESVNLGASPYEAMASRLSRHLRPSWEAVSIVRALH